MGVCKYEHADRAVHLDVQLRGPLPGREIVGQEVGVVAPGREGQRSCFAWIEGILIQTTGIGSLAFVPQIGEATRKWPVLEFSENAIWDNQFVEIREK